MVLPETFTITKDEKMIRFYRKKAYKKARHKKAARRNMYVCCVVAK